MQLVTARRRRVLAATVIVVALVLATLQALGPSAGEAAMQGRGAPEGDAAPNFRVDPFWPQPLPNNWILGQVAGVAVDTQDDVWIVQRPGSLDESERGAALDPPRSNCCIPAPPVIEFDAEGNVLQAWGGSAPGYDWPENEHGIFVDDDDNVWIAGNGGNDHQVLKFTSDGTFLMQIGEAGVTGGSNDTVHLGRPAEMHVDTVADEVYIADGYQNKRVIVFDSETGEYKRHWGAYGNVPNDAPGAPDQFGNPVHCVVLTDDDLVYVCDRPNNRIQIFQPDGTFVREFHIEPDTRGNGSTWDVDTSADRAETFLYNADGENNHIWIMRRASDEVLTTFGRHGRYAGQFHWVHNVATDSRGNLYTAEVDTGKRLQKFTFRGYQPAR